jgi:hypothetical protein
MTLSTFLSQFDGMSPDTKIHILDDWGNLNTPAILTIEDLAADDPFRDLIDAETVVICTNALATGAGS